MKFVESKLMMFGLPNHPQLNHCFMAHSSSAFHSNPPTLISSDETRAPQVSTTLSMIPTDFLSSSPPHSLAATSTATAAQIFPNSESSFQPSERIFEQRITKKVFCLLKQILKYFFFFHSFLRFDIKLIKGKEEGKKTRRGKKLFRFMDTGKASQS